MKKWFDKFIAQSSKGQMFALAAAFAVLIIAGGIIGQFVLEKDSPDSAKFGFRGTWGLMQCVDGGFVDATISSNTKITSTPKGERIARNAPVAVVLLSLGFWLGGMVLISFFTGAATNFLDVRRQKILNGSVDYTFRKKYILIIGYDFQTRNLIKHLLGKNPDPELSIVLVTDLDVAQIYDGLLPELQPSEARRLFIMRKDITQYSSYEKLRITGAETIYIIGDGDAVGRDGKTLQALDALSRAAGEEMKHIKLNLAELKHDLDAIKHDPGAKIEHDPKNKEAKNELEKILKNERRLRPTVPRDRQIKIYLHIQDSVIYSNVRAIELSIDRFNNLQQNIKPIKLLMNELRIRDVRQLLDGLEEKDVRLLADILKRDEPKIIFDLHVFNYYESWAWECWSNKDADDGKEAYLPLRKKGTEHAELFVIGAGRMGLAMVNFAMSLMNYGGDGKHCKITIFDPDGSKRGLFPDQKTLDALPELEVVFRQLDGCSEEANALMLEAADREDTSVTVVIAIPDPTAAIRAYAGFSKQLCRKDISVLIWQETDTESVPDKSYLRMGSSDSLADKRIVRFFGMTDRLPWKNPARFNYGMAVNYYYSCWFPYGKDAPVSPDAAAPDFVEKAEAMWNPEQPEESEYNGVNAGSEWRNTERWKKWSSVNCGDTFREKAALFDGVPYAEAAVKALKAEHNRWWTEKLLAGWQPSEQKSADGASHADKANMIHGDMIPFEELPDEVKDKDKI
ncbi:MAG: hypothetical protein J5858_07275, partial [Lentisphaeria bacterium]|nr:hypothetical protein [Lentisphaeria bacterium]